MVGEMKKLNDRLDALLAQGRMTLEAERDMLREIAEKNGWEWLLNEIRRLN